MVVTTFQKMSPRSPNKTEVPLSMVRKKRKWHPGPCCNEAQQRRSCYKHQESNVGAILWRDTTRLFASQQGTMSSADHQERATEDTEPSEPPMEAPQSPVFPFRDYWLLQGLPRF